MKNNQYVYVISGYMNYLRDGAIGSFHVMIGVAESIEVALNMVKAYFGKDYETAYEDIELTGETEGEWLNPKIGDICGLNGKILINEEIVMCAK